MIPPRETQSDVMDDFSETRSPATVQNMKPEQAQQLGKALADFYLAQPISDARQVLQEAFRQIESRAWCHDYAKLLREYAEFLESSADWKPDAFSHWEQPAKPFTRD